MELWYPPSDQPHLFEWWRPLVLASRAARLDGVPWRIHVDEFVLRGRVDRSGRPPIWVYRHGESGAELYLDPSGQAYDFRLTPKAKGVGRFTTCSIRTAVHRSGLSRWATSIDPIDDVALWSAQAGHPAGRGAMTEDRAPAPVDGPPAPRRRGHLLVHEGGRSLAG